jgi:tetratricopeptide (TPR) repeat protein
MAAFLARQTGQPPTPLYERTADSIVAGVKVVGVRTNYNAMLPPGEQGTAVLPGGNQTFETRLAAIDDLMLITSDDVVMGSLINRTREFKVAPAEGPMARFDFDLGTFIEHMQSLAPTGDASAVLPDDLGNLTMQAEMQNGQLATRTRFNLDDLGRIGAAFSALAVRQAGTPSGGPSEVSTAPAAAERRELEAHPDYWYDRGGLQSAYGAYKAAAHSYRQAVARAPRHADAHFQLGVTHGEMHQFEAAIKAMTRAIDLDADNSAYYYGRGRVFLLAGEEVPAMRDFMEAGFLGNPDARAYLKDAGVSLE